MGDMAMPSGTCGVGAPVLVVAMASVDGSVSQGGSVLQFAVGASGLTHCGPTLTAGQTLNSQPGSIGWMPPNGVLYGASDSIELLDSATGQVRWTYRPTQIGDNPVNVFPLVHGTVTDVGIGYDTHSYGTPDTLALVDGKHGTQINWIDFTTSPAMKLGSDVLAMVQDPRDGTKIVYADNPLPMPHPLVETAVSWDNVTMVTPAVYDASQPTGPSIKALNTVRVGSVSRFAWMQSTSSSSSPDILYEIDDDGAGNQTPYGPLSCASTMCTQPFKSDDVAPDPTKPGRVFAICPAAMAGTALNNVRHVVRIDGNQCDIVVDGTQVKTLTYPAALAVAPSN
jgi:hypothetical protein